jgi:molecular chaperone DnaJ
MAQDYYQTLGISKTASADEIKRAYRKLAHQYHPDKGNGNADKFKEVNEAYQVLSNPDKRAQYDRFGSNFQNNAGFNPGQASGFEGFDFSNFAQGFNVDFEDPFDIFGSIFGGSGRRPRRERGVDLEMDLNLTFDEAVFGVEKEITLQKVDVCEHCQGSGGEQGSKISTCPKCHGQGQIHVMRRTILGQVQTATICDRCEGTGKVPDVACKVCGGSGRLRRNKSLKVKIPAGVSDGQKIRVANEGEVGYRGSNFGDLYLNLHVSEKKGFRREGASIYSEVPISFYQAALGTKVPVDTIDGKADLKIPAGTQPGKIFRIKGKGVPILNSSSRGDQFVTVNIVTPTKLNKKEKEALKKLAEEKGESVDIDESFWGKFGK